MLPFIQASSGVYKILCVPTEKVYIGSSSQLDKRLRDHLSALRGNYHDNTRLQHAWNTYGQDAFTLSILEYVEGDQLFVVEQRYIDHYQSSDPERGFNLSPRATTTFGRKFTPEQSARLSHAIRARYAAGWQHPQSGKSRSDDERAKISAATRGHTKSPATRARMSEAARQRFADPTRHPHYGTHRSPETRAKQALGHAKYYMVVAGETTYFVRNLKAFASAMCVSYNSLRHVITSGKPYCGYSLRLATATEIALYTDRLGDAVFIIIN